MTAGTPLTATGTGTLALNPADAVSGTIASAGRAVNAVNVAVPPPTAAAQIVGEPSLQLTYSGTGTLADTHVFAQIVDEARGVVLGNQATPIPVTLDGQPHTITPPARGRRRLRAARDPLHAAAHRRHAALRPGPLARGDHVQRDQAHAAHGRSECRQRRRGHPADHAHVPEPPALLDPRPRRAPEGHGRGQARGRQTRTGDRRPARQDQGDGQGQGQRPSQGQDGARDAGLPDLHRPPVNRRRAPRAGAVPVQPVYGVIVMRPAPPTG